MNAIKAFPGDLALQWIMDVCEKTLHTHKRQFKKKLQDFLLLEGFPTPIYALFASNRGWKPLQQEEKDAKLTLMVQKLYIPYPRFLFQILTKYDKI